jgi:RNA polymerase sigma-70 factor (ECF subfamily)
MVIAIRPKLMEVAFHSTQSKVESEDIVSKTVIKMLEHEDQFMPGSNFAAWAITITRNVFLDGVARAKPHVPLMLTGPDGQHFDTGTVVHLAPMQSGIIARDGGRGRQAAATPARPEAGHLRWSGYDQIARETKVSKGTVKSRISRARSTLNNT